MSVGSRGGPFGGDRQDMGTAERSFHPVASWTFSVAILTGRSLPLTGTCLQLELDRRNRKRKRRTVLPRGAALFLLRHCMQRDLIVALADHRRHMPWGRGQVGGIALLQQPRRRACPDGRSDDPQERHVLGQRPAGTDALE